MAKTEMLNKMNRNMNRLAFKFKKHSPEILLVTGVVGTVATTIMACKATTKVSTILEKTKADLDAIQYVVENPEMAEKYTIEDAKKDKAIVYTQTAVELGKLYGPAVVVGVASITCILASHNIINKRNAALSAAYTAVSNSYKGYRGRVIERFGEELDYELRHGIKAQEIEETVTDPETGEEKVVKTTVHAVDPNQISEYARFFDDGCKGWTKDATYNFVFLKQTQAYFNDLLHTRGHVYLNEVYDELGIPRTKAGQIVGWVYDESPDHMGDNFIDFGIFDQDNQRKRLFVNGHERTILLDFNVDGNIYDLMK